MHVARWGKSLVLQMSDAEVKALGVKEGDEVALEPSSGRLLPATPLEAGQSRRDEAVTRLRVNACILPAGYRFDREEANAR